MILNSGTGLRLNFPSDNSEKTYGDIFFDRERKAESMSDFRNTKGTETDPKSHLGVRKMMYSHVTIGMVFLSVSVGGIYLYMRSNQVITSLGLTVLVVVGVGILCWAEDIGNKAEKFAERDIPWKHGTEPEEGVGGLLEALPDRYFVFHDYLTKKGHIDHVVVGPKGILTIDTNARNGVVTHDRGNLLLNGNPVETDFIKQAWERSFAIRDLLAQKWVCTLRPKPVIVFTDAEVRGSGRIRGVEIIGIGDLQGLLESLPVWMSERLSKDINACLASNRD